MPGFNADNDNGTRSVEVLCEPLRSKPSADRLVVCDVGKKRSCRRAEVIVDHDHRYAPADTFEDEAPRSQRLGRREDNATVGLSIRRLKKLDLRFNVVYIKRSVPLHFELRPLRRFFR